MFATHFEDDDISLTSFMLQALEWSDRHTDGTRQDFRLLDTFLSSKPDYQLLEAVLSRVASGATASILLAAPDGGFARARARSLASESGTRTRQGLAHVAEAVYSAKRQRGMPDLDKMDLSEVLDVIREGADGLDLQVKFYNDFPSGPLYFMRDLVLVGRCSAGLSAHRGPWQLVVDDAGQVGDLYDSLSREFEEIWATAADRVILDDEKTGRSTASADAVQVVLGICERFSRAITELEVADDLANEADVVKHLTAFLRTSFETVQREESTPATAGRGGRLDVLLPDERIGIEVKFARASQDSKRLIDELLLAQRRYGAHPECSVLVCFVFDPGHRIINRKNLIRDLESASGLSTRVVISP